ncbi:hypothetical protein BS47DRAFT_1345103 [Hydnum rufescens UP504]|uniref:Uncharacterized protein n=1 Tax=Hydnum rufescens UP504 TaxID=1448309 RepID=A0A9P6DWE4_9AGAM|nr:hypothetical protein BS47DRAFT_1345103 [Hydnum rufescens UP504]
MNPNTSSDASSPGGGTSPITASGGSFAGGRNGGRPGISSTPSSAVHLTGDQQRQIPIPSSQSQGQIQAHSMPGTSGRTLSRARSDSAPLGMGLGQIWQVPPMSLNAAPTGGITFSTSGDSSRPRSGTQLAHGRVASTTSPPAHASPTKREDFAGQRTYGSVASSVGSSSGSSNVIGPSGAQSGVHEEILGDSDDSGHHQLQHPQQPLRR